MFLEQAQAHFEKTACDILGIKDISINSYQEALFLMYRYENRYEDPLNQLGEAFQSYQFAYQRYKHFFPSETAASARQKLSEVEYKPHGIIQKVIARFFHWIHKEKIAQYQGRMRVLGPEEEHNLDVQKVLAIFPKFFQLNTPIKNLKELNRFLDRCSLDPVLNERRKWFEGYLAIHVNPNLDILLERTSEKWALHLEERINVISAKMQELHFKYELLQAPDLEGEGERLIEGFVGSYRTLLKARRFIFRNGKIERLTPRSIEKLCREQKQRYEIILREFINSFPEEQASLKAELESLLKLKTHLTEKRQMLEH
ncbi:MAG: hypothetical protein KDK64_08575 [Chlamydiia bacterium]|nr:hypothetical protein [Chlamydiia bacterium]